MAIGSKGAFATTETAGVDVAGMMRGAQQEQSRINQQKLAMDEKVQQAKQSIFDSLEEPTAEMTGEFNTDTLLHEGVNAMKDSLYDYHKKMENGEMTVKDLRGISANYNRQLQGFKNEVNAIQQIGKDFVAKAEEGKLSSGISDRTSLIIEDVFKGNIKPSGVSNQGELMFEVDGKKMTISQFNQTMRNFPQNSNVEGIVGDLSDDFISRIEASTKGFTDIKEVGMTPDQEQEIREMAKGLANTQEFQNDLWFKVKQEKDKLTLTDEEAEVLEKELSEKMVRDVNNRMKNELTKKTNLSEQRKAREAREKKEEEQQVLGVVQGNSFINIGKEGYSTLEDFQKSVNKLYGDERKEKASITDSNFIVVKEEGVTAGFVKGSQIVPVSEGFEFEDNQEFTDFNIDQFTIDDDGNMLAFGFVEVETPSATTRTTKTEKFRGKSQDDEGKTVRADVSRNESDQLNLPKTNKNVEAMVKIDSQAKILQILKKTGLTKEQALEKIKQSGGSINYSNL